MTSFAEILTENRRNVFKTFALLAFHTTVQMTGANLLNFDWSSALEFRKSILRLLCS